MADQIKPVIQINEGKVGIDVTTPFSKLQVGDPDVQAQTMLTVASMYTATPPALNFRTGHPSTSDIWNMAQIRGDDDGSFSGRLEFLTRGATSSGSTTEPVIRMVIDDAGNVRFNNYSAGYLKTDGSGNITAESGIPGTGTFVPLSGGSGVGQAMTGNLHIQNSGPKIYLKDTTDDDDQAIYFQNNSDTIEYIISTQDFTGSGAGDGMFIGSSSSDELALVTNNTTALYIDTSQNSTFSGTIKSSKSVTSGYINEHINTSGNSNAYTSMKWKNDDAAFGEIWRNSSTRSSSGQPALSFNIYNSADINLWSGGTHTLKLTGNNAVFDGDIAMVQTSGNNTLTIDSSGGGNPVIYYKDTSRTWGQFISNGDMYFKDETSQINSLILDGGTGNATFAGTVTTGGSVTTGGNILTLATVGIGTTSPQGNMRLDVRSGSGTGNIGIASYGYNGAGGRAIMGQGYATDNTVAGTSTGVYGHANGARTIAGSINIGGYFAASGSVNNYAIITGGGNVGINNSTPTFGLDVVGTARVTGDTQFVTQSTTDDSTKVATTAFVKNILAEQPAGLTFLGNWNAATNSPALASGGGELANGSSTSLATNKLIDSAATFSSDGITTGTDRIRLVQANGNIEFVVITAVDSDTQLTLASNAVTATGETYIVEASPFLSPEGGYYIVSTTGTTSLNGITDWTSGDWVLIATNNEFQKIDNTSILTGQGAEDKIAKWATSSGNPSVTLASSSITDTGSAVTIDNPTTVTGPLTVNIDANDTLFIKSAGTNAAAVFAASGDELYVGGGDSYSVRYPSSSNIAIFDNSNPGIAINTSNMDIGSAGPATDLTSFLNIVSTTAGVNPTLNISCDNIDEASIILSEESGNQGYGARMYYQGLGNNFFNIQIGDAGTWTNRFTIDRFGDVGIGILAPQGKMTVVGATQTINMDLDANSAVGLSVMGVDSSNFNAFTLGSANSTNNCGVTRFKYNGAGSTNNYLGLGFYGNDDILNVKANGTVGIGLTSPTNTDYGSVIPKLHVYTPGTAGAFDLVARFQAGNDSNDTGGAILINHSNDRGLLIEGGRGGDGATPDDDAISHLGLVTSNGSHTRIMTLKQRNQSASIYGVGIATELPQTKLQIGPLTGGDGTAQERLRLTGDYAGTNSGVLLRFTNQHDSGSNPNTGEYNLAGIIAYDYQSDWGGAMAFQTAPSVSAGGSLVTRMTIDQFGNVGIGTTSPTAYGTTANTLEVRGASGTGTGLIRVSNANNTIGTSLYSSSSSGTLNVQTNHPLTFATNNNEKMRITSGGNVGIGTTSPNTKLHVAGNIRATGQSLFLSTSSVFNKIALNGTDMEIWSGALFPSIDITSAGLLKFGAYALSGAGTPTKLLGVDGSGNVLTTVSGGDLPGGPYLPLSGGTMTGNIHYSAANKATFGTAASPELKIYNNNGGYNMLESSTKFDFNVLELDINGVNGTTPIADLGPNDCRFAYSGAYKLYTTTTGITVANTIDFGGGNNDGIIEVSGSGDLIFKYKSSDPALTLDGGAVKTIVHNRLDALNIVNINNPSNNESILNIRDDDSSSNGHIAFENSSEVTGIVSSGTDFINFRAGDGVAITDSPMLTLLPNRIGVNTTSPNSNVALDIDGRVLIKDSTGVGDLYLGNYATANHFRFHTNNSQTYFDMNCGQINWRQGSSVRYYFYPSTANMTINGTLTQNSDSRVKENVVEIGNCISKVQAMRGVYYNRTDFNTEVTKVGVIAQEVEAVLPELILEASDTGLKSVAYAELTAVLINAVKEQQEIIEDLKTRIAKLEK